MPSHKARASIKRLQKQLEFDHPGVRNLPTKSTKRPPTSTCAEVSTMMVMVTTRLGAYDALL